MNRRIVASRLVVAAPVLLLALASTAGPAVAHEGEDHEGGGGPPEPFVVECEGIEYTLTAGNGEWSAAIDRDSRTVFIPKSFSFTVSQNGMVLFTETQEQGNGNAHKNQKTVTCTFGDSFTDEDGNTFEFTGEAEVVRRPAARR